MRRDLRVEALCAGTPKRPLVVHIDRPQRNLCDLLFFFRRECAIIIQKRLSVVWTWQTAVAGRGPAQRRRYGRVLAAIDLYAGKGRHVEVWPSQTSFWYPMREATRGALAPWSPGRGALAPWSPGRGALAPWSPGRGALAPWSPGRGALAPWSPGRGALRPGRQNSPRLSA